MPRGPSEVRTAFAMACGGEEHACTTRECWQGSFAHNRMLNVILTVGRNGECQKKQTPIHFVKHLRPTPANAVDTVGFFNQSSSTYLGGHDIRRAHVFSFRSFLIGFSSNCHGK